MELPPLETACRLIKPRSLVRATWGDAKEVASWLGGQLALHSARFASQVQRDATHLARLVNSAVERLESGARRSASTSVNVSDACPWPW